MTARPRLLFLVSEDWYFLSHRIALARAARAAGFDVFVATRVNDLGEAIRAEGFTLLPITMDRGGVNPLKDLAVLAQVIRIYRKVRPDVVHHVAIKPVLYGSLAARLAGVGNVINALAGLGFVFTATSWKARLLRPLLWGLFRLLLGGKNNRLIVQNHDDQGMFAGSGLIAPDRIQLIRGSGIDTTAFQPMPEPDGVVRAALVARMLWDKGVCEAVDAARILKRRGIAVEIALVGKPDPANPRSITQQQLDAWQREGVVRCLGHQDDIRAVWRDAHIGLLPSYREGLPKALLEAAACGRPLIATDVPGCRELVRHGVNGLLVPAQNPDSLADALERLVTDPALRHSLGAEARRLAETEFSLDGVVAAHLELYRARP
ncbi:MAG: glycosyltransferase family 4 protein [Rhodospirillaceae bacterium]|nr:glycosyltransferase family 4 protein [Rhodospirillales bacterium]